MTSRAFNTRSSTDPLIGGCSIRVGRRYALMPKPNSFNVVLDTAIKVPLGGDEFFSTGRVDVGAQLTAQWYTGRHAFYASGALVYDGGSPAPFNDSSQIVPTGIVGYEFRWLENTNLIAQFYVSPSTVRGEQTDLDELRSNKYQVSLGSATAVAAWLRIGGFHGKPAEREQHAGFRISNQRWIQLLTVDQRSLFGRVRADVGCIAMGSTIEARPYGGVKGVSAIRTNVVTIQT